MNLTSIRRLGAAAVATVMPLGAMAQNSGWQWDAAVYGWFPGIIGTTQFPSGASGPSLDVPIDTVVDALKMAAMGTVQGRNGKWGFFSDLFYADIGGSKQGVRDFTIGNAQIPAGVTGNFVLDMKTVLWTTAGFYNLVATTENTTDLLFGARYANIRETLSWSLAGNIGGLPLPVQSGSSLVSLTHWDGIVGIKGRAYFGDGNKWFVPYYADIGTGESKLTWQISAGLGYQFDWGAVIGTWRYLDYEMKSGVPITSMALSGPMLGVAFKF